MMASAIAVVLPLRMPPRSTIWPPTVAATARVTGAGSVQATGAMRNVGGAVVVAAAPALVELVDAPGLRLLLPLEHAARASADTARIAPTRRKIDVTTRPGHLRTRPRVLRGSTARRGTGSVPQVSRARARPWGAGRRARRAHRRGRPQ